MAVVRWVSCAECAARYDTQATTFCPRCGSTLRGRADAELAPLSRDDPRRRRVQMGGAILLLVGLAIALLVGAQMVWGPTLVDAVEQQIDARGDQPLAAGELHVQLVRDGHPAAGHLVALLLPSGQAYLQGNTTGAGWYNVSLGRQAAVTIVVHEGNRTLERRAFVPWSVREEVRLDLRRDPDAAATRVGLQDLEVVTPILYGSLLLGACLTAVGGAAALGLRGPTVAVAAPLPIAVATLLWFLFTYEPGMLALLGLQVAAIWMVASGRSSFRRR
ncbi:MAG: hypothetical protein QOD77_2165 [Thermoplasmata archaeon]|nr:hypothetical protein [Thermoplasmata archaeon]